MGRYGIACRYKGRNASDCQEIPAINEMVRKMDELHSIAVKKGSMPLYTFRQTNDILILYNRYPELVQRFPQHIIASYLGITKETLSRVRKRPVKK